MHLKRRTALVGGEVAERAGTTLRPLTAPVSRLIALGGREHPVRKAAPERDDNGRITAVLSDMAEQVRRLAVTVESLRSEIR